MFIHVIDNDLYVKLMEPRDGEKLFSVIDHSRDYLREWLPWVDKMQDTEDAIRMINDLSKGFVENKNIHTVIIYKGEIAGVASFNSINKQNNTANIGYWIDKDYQGKGIVCKVVSSLIEYAFKELNMNKVEIWAAADNEKSRNIAKRLGFVKEGCIRDAEWLHDHYVDHIVYGMLASEWKTKK